MGDMSELNQSTDEELMREYQNGNEIAFTILYKKHAAKVYGFLIGKLHDRAFADDVFQSTFLKLHQARHQYDSTLPFTPWLFTVCRSVMIDQARKKQRALDVVREVLDEEIEEKIDLNTLELITPDTLQALSEPLSLISLDKLSNHQRQILQLRYEDDLSFEEIAKKLETTPTNARQLASRAVKKLRGLLNHKEEKKKK